MADGPAFALQRALIVRLKADAGIAALVGDRVYDEPPQRALVFPYIRLGNIDVYPARGDGCAAWSVPFGIEVHSRPRQGRVEAVRIAGAVADALDEQEGSMTLSGYRLAWMQFVTQSVSRMADGKSYQATIAFDAMVDAL